VAFQKEQSFMSENNENKVINAETPQENTETDKTRNLRDFSPVRVGRILLLILCVLFLIGIWFHNNPSSPVINTDPAEDEGTSKETEPSPLPAELTDPSSITVLVNKTHSLPADYVPEELVTPYVNSTSDVIQVSSKAADQLKEMVTKAAEDEVTLYLTAGYISYETQDDYFHDRAGMVGEAEANKVIARAGFSEHQTGLAFDFSDEASGTATTVAFADTKAGQWLLKHSWEYGFILRYPEGKESITGYSYQPWHYRFVGRDAAKAMHETAADLTMEEYYNIQ
jgi:D-alanyl-D-alanine carboxypeptidase